MTLQEPYASLSTPTSLTIACCQLKGEESEIRQTLIRVPALLLTFSVTLVKLFNL